MNKARPTPSQGRPSGGPSRSEPRQPRGPVALLVWCLCALLMFSGFCALGVWQIERRAWKLDLIQRVNERVHAPAVAAPEPQDGSGINRERDEYRHVRVSGSFLPDKVTLVQAGTKLGTGYWVMTPLRRADGTVVIINRGFVSQDDGKAAAGGARTPSGTVTVTGLLRLTEPGGGLFRDNKPTRNRWYSRDVKAIAAARGLNGSKVAPYFIDAGRPRGGPDIDVPTGEVRNWPVDGLTVIHFHNSHMIYAITWFSMALLVLLSTAYVVREERRLRRSG